MTFSRSFGFAICIEKGEHEKGVNQQDGKQKDENQQDGKQKEAHYGGSQPKSRIDFDLVCKSLQEAGLAVEVVHEGSESIILLRCANEEVLERASRQAHIPAQFNIVEHKQQERSLFFGPWLSCDADNQNDRKTSDGVSDLPERRYSIFVDRKYVPELWIRSETASTAGEVDVLAAHTIHIGFLRQYLTHLVIQNAVIVNDDDESMDGDTQYCEEIRPRRTHFSTDDTDSGMKKSDVSVMKKSNIKKKVLDYLAEKASEVEVLSLHTLSDYRIKYGQYLKTYDPFCTRSHLAFLGKEVLGFIPKLSFSKENIATPARNNPSSTRNSPEIDKTNNSHNTILERQTLSDKMNQTEEKSKSAWPYWQRKLWKMKCFLDPLSPASLDSLFTYFGAKIASYFLFIHCFNRFLFLPAIVGFLMWETRPDGVTLDTSSRAPLYAALVVISGCFFVRNLERVGEHYALRHGVLLDLHVAQATNLWGMVRKKDKPASTSAKKEYHHVKRGKVSSPKRGTDNSTVPSKENPKEDSFASCKESVIRFVTRVTTRQESVNPITGEGKFVPDSKFLRYVSQLFSIIITSCMLCVAFSVMILSLNLQGYIHGAQDAEVVNTKANAAADPNRQLEDHEHLVEGLEKLGNPFHIPFIAQFALPGRILDPTGDGDPFFGGWITMLPTVLHVLCITQLNKIYKGMAGWLTEIEAQSDSRMTDTGFESSLITKRFLFEAFDCYISLFYIAFFERDIVKLRSELISLYTVDSARRVLTETVLPLLSVYWTVWTVGVGKEDSKDKDRKIKDGKSADRTEKTETAKESQDRKKHHDELAKKHEFHKFTNKHWKKTELLRSKFMRMCSMDVGARKKDHDHDTGTGNPNVSLEMMRSIKIQRAMEEYEAFDDWLELVIEFGYVTLFASAFPLASGISLICNQVEAISDREKLFNVCKRPIPERQISFKGSIYPETWVLFLKCIVWLSVLTNCLIFGYSSRQLTEVILNWKGLSLRRLNATNTPMASAELPLQAAGSMGMYQAMTSGSTAITGDASAASAATGNAPNPTGDAPTGVLSDLSATGNGTDNTGSYLDWLIAKFPATGDSLSLQKCGASSGDSSTSVDSDGGLASVEKCNVHGPGGVPILSKNLDRLNPGVFASGSPVTMAKQNPGYEELSFNQSMWVAFIFEHFVGVVCFLVFVMIPSAPKSVRQALKRRSYFMNKQTNKHSGS